MPKKASAARPCPNCGYDPTPYTCRDCGGKFSKAKVSYSDIDHEARLCVCSECNVKRWEPTRREGPLVSSEYQRSLGDTYGGIYAGPNLGLDATPRNRGEWKEIAKAKGLRHKE